MRAEGVDADEAARAEAELWERTQHLDGRELVGVIRAFSVFFQLVNTADQHHRVRRRRWRDAEREEAHRAQPESLAAAFAAFAERAVTAGADRLGARPALDRAGGDAASHRGLAPHRPRQAHARGRVPRLPRQLEPVAARAPRDRGAPARGDHDPLAERRDAIGPPAGDRRGAPGALLLRGGALRHHRHGARGARAAAGSPLPGPAAAGGLPALRLVGGRRPGRQPQLHAGAGGGGARPAHATWPTGCCASGCGRWPPASASRPGWRRSARSSTRRSPPTSARCPRPPRRSARATPASRTGGSCRSSGSAWIPGASAPTRAPASWWRTWR